MIWIEHGSVPDRTLEAGTASEETTQEFEGVLPKSQNQILVLTVVYVPNFM